MNIDAPDNKNGVTIMPQRSDLKILCEEIMKRPKDVEKLDVKEKAFLYSMNEQTTHYGFDFTEKQSKWLQAIYRKVYANV